MEIRPDMSQSTSRELAEEMVSILYRKGASDIQLYAAAEDASLTDYHLMATGRSSTHVKSLGDELAFEMSERGVAPRGTEGRNGGNWILLDYISVIVHIFDAPSREFYRIERLQKPEQQVDVTPAIERAKLN